MNTLMHDELLDIVNSHDQVIGQQYKAEVYAQKLSNFRVINAFLINSNKQVWIPRRSPSKKLFPLCLDASVGGHVIAGESYHEAFVRELQEELNMHVDDFHSTLVAKLSPENNGVSAHMHVYVIHTDVEPAYNRNDFVEARWYSLDQLQQLISQGEPTKGDLPALIALLSTSL